MYFKQFYLDSLAQASYFIASNGEAAVVDPQRDVDQYMEEARSQRVNIRYVIETHVHADFVSGHLELARRTGAQIVFGRKARATCAHFPAKDGDEFKVGSISLRVLETPGHTPDSISILVLDPSVSSEPVKVLTGDTLFIGDAGRPDLAVGQQHTVDDMAAMLHESLQKLLKLPDAVEVYPGHGAGSVCGKNLSTARSSTIGEQRSVNPALQPMAREEFVRLMTTDLPARPKYCDMAVNLNRSGADELSDLPQPVALSPDEAAQRQAEGAILVDVRTAAAFGAGHVPGSVNLGLSGHFAPWAGNLLAPDQRVVIVADQAAEVAEAVVQLARVGLQTASGFLQGGVDAWSASGRTLQELPQWTVAELKTHGSAVQIIDVRRPAEYEAGHVVGARSVPLAFDFQVADVDGSRPVAVICRTGYRSSAAGSLLQRQGVKGVHNVEGGTEAWLAAGYPVQQKCAGE